MTTATKQAAYYVIRLKGTVTDCRFDSLNEALERFEWHEAPCRLSVVFTDGTRRQLHSTI